LTLDFNTHLFTPPIKSSPEWSFSSTMAHVTETNNSECSTTDNESSTMSSLAWRQSIVPTRAPLSSLKQHSMEFTLRILRTWPHMMASGLQTPPIFHSRQVKQENMLIPLANCYIIANMWHGQCDKSSSLVHETTVREVISLFQNVRLPSALVPQLS
jgi:hypothetical protein